MKRLTNEDDYCGTWCTTNKEACAKYRTCYKRRMYDRLKMYEDLEAQGSLFRMPFNTGDDIYFIPSKTNFKLNILSGHDENNRIYHQKIAKITLTEKTWYVEGDKNIEYGVDKIFPAQLFGETWFLTEKEAEDALEKMKGEEHETD